MEPSQLVVVKKRGAASDTRAELAAAIVNLLALLMVRLENKSPQLAIRYAKAILSPALPSFEMRFVTKRAEEEAADEQLVAVTDYPNVMDVLTALQRAPKEDVNDP